MPIRAATLKAKEAISGIAEEWRDLTDKEEEEEKDQEEDEDEEEEEEGVRMVTRKYYISSP